MTDVDRSLLRVSFWSGLLALVGLAVLIMLISGCGTFSQEQVDSLVGKPFPAAERMFGKAPDKQVTTPEGVQIYTWEMRDESFRVWAGDALLEIVSIWLKDGNIIKARYRRETRKY